MNNRSEEVFTPTLWKVNPIETKIDFDSIEQRSLLKNRLNTLNNWMHRCLVSGNLWGISVAKQHYDMLNHKYHKPRY